MNSTRLKYFIVLTETESVRKAAEILHITPAALSKAIKQLEVETGITLLVPSGRGIVVTDEGREFAKRAQPFIYGLEKLKNEIKERKQFNSNNKVIRIGSFEIFTTYFLNNLAPALSEECDLILSEYIPGDMEKALLNQEIDYGITYIPVPTAEIQHKFITTTVMDIYGLPSAFLSHDFSSLPFAVPNHALSNLPNQFQCLDGWPEGPTSRFIKYRVAMLESALELCRQGRAVAYLPDFIIDLHNKAVKQEYNLQPLRFNPPLPKKELAIYLIKRKFDAKASYAEKISEAIRQSCLRA